MEIWGLSVSRTKKMLKLPKIIDMGHAVASKHSIMNGLGYLMFIALEGRVFICLNAWSSNMSPLTQNGATTIDNSYCLYYCHIW